MIVHSLLATFDPVFIIQEQVEGMALARAWAKYLSHSRAIMSPRTRDLGVLCLTIAAIEGPRLKRAMENKRTIAMAARAEARARAEASGRVVPMGA